MDDLSLRAELMRQVMNTIPQEVIIAVLPETAGNLNALASLGQATMASYLDNWQKAQEAKLKHLQFQLTTNQLEVVDEALSQVLPMAKSNRGDSPNNRGTALFLLCKSYLERNQGNGN